ncbi:IclR family transcriptional regulator [Paenarthrobacter nicotinovorans]|uniref:IclR family transcriptional regulator n=1 Tax=Paenarthrobacter nicotinovorans TaxID=29320 RepID=UPI003812E5E4
MEGAPVHTGGGSISDDASTIDEDVDPEIGSESLNRSALRAAALLIATGDHPLGASAAELANETGIPRPTAFRILLSLVHSGLLSRDGGTFALGWRTARLGRLADPYRDLLTRVQPLLDGLAADVNESVEFVMFTGPTTQATIAQASSGRLLAPSEQYVGRTFPLHATATGKVLLADLDDHKLKALLPETLEAMTDHTITDREALLNEIAKVRAVGFATLDGELEEGLYVVAVPVPDSAGKPVAGLAVSGLSERMQSTTAEAYVAKMRVTADKLSRVLNGPSSR